METEALQDALAEYVGVLAKSADSTTQANDRNLYQLHLAEAARIFAELRAGDLDAVRERVAGERRGFGWSYLTGPEGEAAERAWHAFASRVESTQ